MAVKFGVAFGCEVYVISRSRSKEAHAKAMGAKGVIPSGDEEEMKKAAGKQTARSLSWLVSTATTIS
jgi:uncharacterized zinc-type alcohol dehydrogenase-like protein